MVQHLVRSALIVLPSLGLLVFVCRKWNVGARSTIRNFTIAAAMVLISVAVLSETAVVRERRCRRDPSEFCLYNDNVPAISVLVFIFFLTAVIRSSMLYSER